MENILDFNNYCRRRINLDSSPESMWTMRRCDRGQLAGVYVDTTGIITGA